MNMYMLIDWFRVKVIYKFISFLYMVWIKFYNLNYFNLKKIIEKLNSCDNNINDRIIK